MSNDEKITIPVSLDKQYLWDTVFGSDLYGAGSWWLKLHYVDGHPFKVIVTVEPEVGEKPIKRTITVDDLARGLGLLLADGQTHCGHYSLLGEPDSCTSDMILQAAIFGKVVFG